MGGGRWRWIADHVSNAARIAPCVARLLCSRICLGGGGRGCFLVIARVFPPRLRELLHLRRTCTSAGAPGGSHCGEVAALRHAREAPSWTVVGPPLAWAASRPPWCRESGPPHRPRSACRDRAWPCLRGSLLSPAPTRVCSTPLEASPCLASRAEGLPSASGRASWPRGFRAALRPPGRFPAFAWVPLDGFSPWLLGSGASPSAVTRASPLPLGPRSRGVARGVPSFFLRTSDLVFPLLSPSLPPHPPTPVHGPMVKGARRSSMYHIAQHG